MKWQAAASSNVVPLTDLQLFLRRFEGRSNRPITLPPGFNKQKKAPDNPKRNAIVSAIAKILETGWSSRFLFEGSCRSGLRSSLCLKGWRWSEADGEAAAIVGAALRQIGARRPSWLEGQPEYCQPGHVPKENYFCAHCGRPIGERDPQLSGIPRIYCSRACGDAAVAARARRFKKLMDQAEYAAFIAAKKLARSQASADAKVRFCENCGKEFEYTKKSSKYCSHRCATIATRKPVKLTCVECGNEFENISPAAKTCSDECRKISYRRVRLQKAAADFLCEAAE